MRSASRNGQQRKIMASLVRRGIHDGLSFRVTRTGGKAAERNRQSILVGERVNDEDVGICESVQRGLHSRAYGAGRLSVRREAGEHLFHRLLAADLKRGNETSAGL